MIAGTDPSSGGTAVADGVYRFGTERINWDETADAVTVVDAGLPAHWPQLAAWLEERGYGFEAVDTLLLTHADADHVGFVDRLRAEGVPTYLHDADRPLAEGHPHGAPRWFRTNL